MDLHDSPENFYRVIILYTSSFTVTDYMGSCHGQQLDLQKVSKPFNKIFFHTILSRPNANEFLIKMMLQYVRHPFPVTLEKLKCHRGVIQREMYLWEPSRHASVASSSHRSVLKMPQLRIDISRSHRIKYYTAKVIP